MYKRQTLDDEELEEIFATIMDGAYWTDQNQYFAPIPSEMYESFFTRRKARGKKGKGKGKKGKGKGKGKFGKGNFTAEGKEGKGSKSKGTKQTPKDVDHKGRAGKSKPKGQKNRGGGVGPPSTNLIEQEDAYEGYTGDDDYDYDYVHEESKDESWATNAAWNYPPAPHWSYSGYSESNSVPPAPTEWRDTDTWNVVIELSLIHI